MSTRTWGYFIPTPGSGFPRSRDLTPESDPPILDPSFSLSQFGLPLRPCIPDSKPQTPPSPITTWLKPSQGLYDLLSGQQRHDVSKNFIRLTRLNTRHLSYETRRSKGPE